MHDRECVVRFAIMREIDRAIQISGKQRRARLIREIGISARRDVVLDRVLRQFTLTVARVERDEIERDIIARLESKTLNVGSDRLFVFARFKVCRAEAGVGVLRTRIE